MINIRLPVIVCGRKSVTRLQNKTILRACEIRFQVSLSLRREH